VLNKRQEFPNPDDGKESFTKEGWQEQRYETDFFLQRQTMHVAVPQCMLGMSVVLVHDRVGLGRSTYDESDPWRKDPQPLRRRG